MFTLLMMLTAVTLLCAFHLVTRYNRRGRMLRGMPGPTAYPLVGNLLKFNVSCLNKFWEVGREVMRNHYPLAKIWLCSTAVVNVQHPDDLEAVFSSQKIITKGYIYDYLHPWLKTGLLTSTGDKWRQRRKILTPAFHYSILREYLEIANEEGRKLIDLLRSDEAETVRDLMPFCSNCTLNIICEAAMGVSLSGMDKREVGRYTRAVHEMGNLVVYRMSRPYVYDWMMPFLPCGEKQRRTVKTLHDFTGRVIKDRQEYHAKHGDEFLNDVDGEIQGTRGGDDDVGKKKKKRLAMLDLLLVTQKNGQIDDEGITEEVDTFTFEGHDTTGMAMTFTLLLLAENREAQRRARLEVTELLDRANGQIDMAILQEMNYLERCIKESLRLYPPVATMTRHASEDFQLKHGMIPADTTVLIHIFDTHRDPNFWPKPEKFDPDRFLPENCKERHPFAYVPFSAGPRNCIGQKFAMMELKSLICRILYNFYLEPIDLASSMRLMADIVIRPLDPVHIKLIRIDR